MAVKSFKIKKNSQLIILGVAVVIYLIAVFFFARWCFASSIARQAATTQIAELTIDLAPNDPQAHYALAVLSEKSFLPEDLEKALQEYETATALAPYDFRLWLELGIARGQNGDNEGAEKALRRALELAPNHAEVQWALGNKLVRQENSMKEGFEKIQSAARGNPKFIKPAISTAWLIFDGNVAQIKKYIGDFPELNAELAMFLAEQNKFDGAIEIWNKLPEEKKKSDLKKFGEDLYKVMLGAKKYRHAFQINEQINEDETKSFVAGKVYNGGFETDVDPTSTKVFEWQLGSGVIPQIGFDDGQKRGGKRSLVILYSAENDRKFRTISQTVVVEPNKNYVFEAFYKSNLEKTPATLKWDIIEASSGKVISSTPPIEKNTDWTSIKTSFKASENSEAVIIRMVRESCRTSLCPIMGKVWFDDVSVKLLDSSIN